MLSDLLDALLLKLGLPVAACCNGSTFFAGCLVFTLVCAASSGRLSLLRLLASSLVGLFVNIVRILILLPLVRLPYFGFVHDLFGWFLAGMGFVFILELYGPSVTGARLVGVLTLVALFVWGILYIVARSLPI